MRRVRDEPSRGRTAPAAGRQVERGPQQDAPARAVSVTAAGSMWIAFGAAGLLAAVFLGAPWLGTIALVAAAWTVGEEWYVRALLRRLQATRFLPAEVTRGEQVRGRVEIIGRGPLPILWGAVLSPLGLDLDRTRDIPLPALLPPGRRAVVAVEGPCHARRGWHRLHPAWVRTWGPLGLVCGQVAVEGAAEVLVLPAVERLGSWPARRTHRHLGRPAETRARNRAGWPTSTPRSVREYRPGDRFRDIHWKQTARVGSLVAIERERAVAGESWVWPDLHDYRDAAGQAITPVMTEEVIRVCASIGCSLALTGTPAGLAVQPARAPVLEPGTGPGHAARWRAACATLPDALPEHMEDLLASWAAASIAPADLICVLAAAVWPPSILLDRLALLRDSGWNVLPLLVEDLSQARAFDLERRLWRRDRSASDLWRALGDAGWHLHLVPLGARLEPALASLVWEVGRR